MSERRDVSPFGIAGRKRFSDSLGLLRALGLSPAAIEHYRRQARKTRKLPHELVCAMAEDGARTVRRVYYTRSATRLNHRVRVP